MPFEKGRQRIEAEKLKATIGSKLSQMVHLNKSRLDYLEKFQKMIDEYNTGAINVEIFFGNLLVFAQELSEEEKRGISEQLSEEELAIFDLLTKPEMSPSPKEKKQVTKDLYREKCDVVYQHIYDSYYGLGKSIYDQAA